jgi:hypothetical protein
LACSRCVAPAASVLRLPPAFRMGARSRKGGGGRGGGSGSNRVPKGGKSGAGSAGGVLQTVWLPAAGLLAVALLVSGFAWRSKQDSGSYDRVKPLLEKLGYPVGSPVTPEAGKEIAQALNLQKWMDDIVVNNPKAQYVSHNPPIIQFDDFLSAQECEEMIAAGKPGLMASTGTGQLKNGRFERTTIDGRTSCETTHACMQLLLISCVVYVHGSGLRP